MNLKQKYWNSSTWIATLSLKAPLFFFLFFFFFTFNEGWYSAKYLVSTIFGHMLFVTCLNSSIVFGRYCQNWSTVWKISKAALCATTGHFALRINSMTARKFNLGDYGQTHEQKGLKDEYALTLAAFFLLSSSLSREIWRCLLSLCVACKNPLYLLSWISWYINFL